MGIEEIFAKERERYVQFFVQARDGIASKEPNTVSELLISINNEAIPYPYRYLRVDVISKCPDGEDKPYEVTLDPDSGFEAKGFNFGAFTVEVYPFTWNATQILFNNPIKNTKQFEGWVTRWLDVDEKNKETQSRTSSAVHSFTRVEHHDGWWYLTADFGTAPADALIEFIELLAHQGMTKIVIKGGNA